MTKFGLESFTSCLLNPFVLRELVLEKLSASQGKMGSPKESWKNTMLGSLFFLLFSVVSVSPPSGPFFMIYEFHGVLNINLFVVSVIRESSPRSNVKSPDTEDG